MSSKFSDLPLQIVQSMMTIETIHEFKEIPRPNFMYNVVISGCIGAGKSTCLDMMAYLLEQTGKPVNSLPEFVNMHLGIDILKERIEDKISCLTFQSFILDRYLQNELSKNKINLLERLPDESVLCFCLENFISGQITEDELNVLWKKAGRIDKEKEFPSYREKHVVTIIEKTDINEILQEIGKNMRRDIKHHASKEPLTHIFMLRIDSELSIQRVLFRDRDGEKYYTPEYITRICEIYNRLIEKLCDERESTPVDEWFFKIAYLMKRDLCIMPGAEK